MMNKVSRCYKTFDKKHNLEKIDTETLKFIVKMSKDKEENYSSFLGDKLILAPLSVISTVQTSLSPFFISNKFTNAEGMTVVVDPPTLPAFVSYVIFIPHILIFFYIYNYILSIYIYFYFNCNKSI